MDGDDLYYIYLLSDASKLRLYYAKITLDGELLHEFIPCLAFGYPAMYDKVEDKFMNTLGGGNIIAGPPKATAEDAESIVLNKNRLKLCPGKTAALKATVTPESANTSLVWSSTNELVAVVDV